MPQSRYQNLIYQGVIDRGHASANRTHTVADSQQPKKSRIKKPKISPKRKTAAEKISVQ